MSDLEWDDPILALARDPNLNKEKAKTSRLILLIQGFPVVERKVSRLCLLSLNILQTLEKIELTLKNWAFMSLDINSANHFDATNPTDIKAFNNNVSQKVIISCQELTAKLNKITADIDFITSALRTLSPIEYISDSGTLLTSLTLRNIRLKDELRDKVTIAYLKAKLITIGTDLESMLGGADTHEATVKTYRQFVVSLLRQLNTALDQDDSDDRNECLAVISDMEQMFEAFKLERAQNIESDTDDISDYESDDTSPSLQTVNLGLHSITLHSNTLYTPPMVHSITKQPMKLPEKLSDISFENTRRGSVTSMASTSMLQRSTITEELPYLMSAFNLAKTIEEDIAHFGVENPSPIPDKVAPTSVKQFPKTKTHLPDTALYTDSQFAKPLSSPSAYLYANNSLLSKLGFRPQVITTDMPRHLADSTNRRAIEDKENNHPPLTRENLETHTMKALTTQDGIPDYVE